LTAALLSAGTVWADPGDFVLGGGFSADDTGGLAIVAIGDVEVFERTWLTGSVGRTSVDLQDALGLETWYSDIGLDHFFDPAGIRLGAAYWGDSDILDSVDVSASLYTRNDGGSISADFVHRDFELDLPPLDFLPRQQIPFSANGFGLSGRIDATDNVDLRIAGMSFEYDVDLRSEQAARLIRLLSVSRLSLLSSLIDWRVSAGVGVDVGLRRWQFDVAKWRGAIDGGDNQSATITFVTPMTDRTDIEFSVGYDQSELYGDVAIFNVFFFFFGGG
jgi:hypothetical protein